MKKTILVILLTTAASMICGCGEKVTYAERKAILDAQIAKKLPSSARIAASAGANEPLKFKATVDGTVYYIGNGDIFLNTPLKANDTIRLNHWSMSGIPNTQVLINGEIVYHNPTARYGDNRFYFIPKQQKGYVE